MIQVASQIEHRQIAGRACSLLQAFFTDYPDLKRAVFDRAFSGYAKDPRGLVDISAPPLVLAAESVSVLLAYGCTDGRRHALGRLLTVIREDFLGANPHADYSELPRLLNGPCGLPNREEERTYLERLLADIEHKAALYAPLRAVARIAPKRAAEPLLGAWDDLALLRHVRSSGPATEVQSQPQLFDDILDAFSQIKRCALLGRPGAGKTTTLRKLTADLAIRALAEPDAPIPLLVSLGEWTGGASFAEFIAERLPGVGDALLPLSRVGRLILLLDGLNEVPTGQRVVKSAAIRKMIDGLDRETPVFVSCRADDYQGDLDLGMDTLSLEPLSPQRVRAVLRHWLRRIDPQGGEARAERLFWQLAGDEALAGVLKTWLAVGGEEYLFWTTNSITRDQQNLEGKLSGAEKALRLRHVRDPRSLLRLAANPFMLTMLFWVWIDRGETLPRNRGDLFTRFVDALLDRERLLLPDDSIGDVCYTPDGKRLLLGLASLAWTMQGRSISGMDALFARAWRDDRGALTVVRRDEAITALGGDELIQKAVDATLLEGDVELRFRHQLLQEFFTALGMKNRIDSGELAAEALWPALRWWERSGWEESAVLLAGLYAEDCTPIIRWLINAQPEVAGQCICESGAEISNRQCLFQELQSAWLPRLTDVVHNPEPEARAAVGRVLGRLDLDSRKGVGVFANDLPEIDWVAIQACEFVYQDWELRRLETFHIARYPITNAQFQCFLDARDGYANDCWWNRLDISERDPRRSGCGISNHPREQVNWFEAVAFCAWLGHRLGLAIRLPTEWEWERAARGTKGRLYPWGDAYQVGYANVDETRGEAGPHNLKQTTAVGLYPQGNSPEGVIDLAGNVWEWCMNEYYTPENVRRDGRELRVVRGGSWITSSWVAQGGDRSLFSPDVRLDSLGFRVLWESLRS